MVFARKSEVSLYTHGKAEQAKEFIIKYHGEGNPENAFVKLQIQEFEEFLVVEGSDKRWWDYRILFSSRASLYRLGCNLLLSIYGQLTGGGLGYFSAAFLQSCGITDPITVLNFNLGTSFISPVMAYLGASYCDKLGRRPKILGAWLASICAGLL